VLAEFAGFVDHLVADITGFKKIVNSPLRHSTCRAECIPSPPSVICRIPTDLRKGVTASFVTPLSFRWITAARDAWRVRPSTMPIKTSLRKNFTHGKLLQNLCVRIAAHDALLRDLN